MYVHVLGIPVNAHHTYWQEDEPDYDSDNSNKYRALFVPNNWHAVLPTIFCCDTNSMVTMYWYVLCSAVTHL